MYKCKQMSSIQYVHMLTNIQYTVCTHANKCTVYSTYTCQQMYVIQYIHMLTNVQYTVHTHVNKCTI